VNLLTLLPKDQVVDSFSKQPIFVGQQLQLIDAKGNSVEIKSPATEDLDAYPTFELRG
jgi:hypothetical protein